MKYSLMKPFLWFFTLAISLGFVWFSVENNLGVIMFIPIGLSSILSFFFIQSCKKYADIQQYNLYKNRLKTSEEKY